MVEVKLKTLTPVVIHQEEFGEIAYLIKDNQRVSLSKDAELKAIKEIKDIVKNEQLDASVFKEAIRKIYEEYLDSGDVVPLYGVRNYARDNIIYLNNISLMTAKTYKNGKIMPYIPGSTIKGMIRSALGDKLNVCEKPKEINEILTKVMQCIEIGDFYPLNDETSIGLYKYLSFGIGKLRGVPLSEKRGLDLTKIRNIGMGAKREIIYYERLLSNYYVEAIDSGVMLVGDVKIVKERRGYKDLERFGISDEQELLDFVSKYYRERYTEFNEKYYSLIKEKGYSLDVPINESDLIMRVGHGKPIYYNTCKRVINDVEDMMKDTRGNVYYHPNEKFVYAEDDQELLPLGWVKIER